MGSGTTPCTSRTTGCYEALIRWIEDSGYHLARHSRELYHKMRADGPSVTELQMPIAK